MVEYVFDAHVRLRVTGEDFYDVVVRAEEFFGLGLQHLAYSTDPDDDHYEVESVKIDWNSVKEV